MLVFRLRLYLKYLMENYNDAVLHSALKNNANAWYMECDGKEVIRGWIGRYYIAKEWCEYVVQK